MDTLVVNLDNEPLFDKTAIIEEMSDNTVYLWRKKAKHMTLVRVAVAERIRERLVFREEPSIKYALISH